MHSCASRAKYKYGLWCWISSISRHLTTSIKAFQTQVYLATSPAVGPPIQLLSKPQPARLQHRTWLLGTAVNTNTLMPSICSFKRGISEQRIEKGVQGRGGTRPWRWGTRRASGSICKTTRRLLPSGLSLPGSEGLFYKSQSKSWLSYK